jgi:hypothetical protein
MRQIDWDPIGAHPLSARMHDLSCLPEHLKREGCGRCGSFAACLVAEPAAGCGLARHSLWCEREFAHMDEPVLVEACSLSVHQRRVAFEWTSSRSAAYATPIWRRISSIVSMISTLTRSGIQSLSR